MSERSRSKAADEAYTRETDRAIKQGLGPKWARVLAKEAAQKVMDKR